MNPENKFERRSFQLLILILAVICFVPGGASTFGGINASAMLGGAEPVFKAESMLRGFTDNQYRFGFGVFLAQGFLLLYFLRNIEEHGTLFRFSALALFIGGIGRLTNIMEFGLVDEQVLAPTIIEILFVPLLIIWHRRIIKNGLATRTP